MRIGKCVLAVALLGGCSQETCDHGKATVNSAGKDLEQGVDQAKVKTKEAVNEAGERLDQAKDDLAHGTRQGVDVVAPGPASPDAGL